MIRTLLFLWGALVVSGVSAEAPGYDDIKAVFAGVSSSVDTLAQDIDQAKAANDVAQAFVKFGSAMKAFKQAMMEFQEKYPELTTADEPPETLQESLAAMQASFGQLSR